jgi:hypothetical protein
MKKIIESKDFVVYDDLLDSETFKKINHFVQQEKYSIPHIESWLKVWRMSDGLTMGSRPYNYDKNEEVQSDNYMGYIFNYFKQLSELHEGVIGDWKKITLRSYLYGRDTKLSWHNDAGYAGAGIFYIHSYWGSTWGGELMIAQTPNVESIPDPSIDHSFEDKFLEHYGLGQYITCKPNRIVLTKGGLWHSINRIDKDAGDHIRMSIVAFFHN